MGRIIKRFSDGSFLEYDWGNFDGWCVYHTDPNGIRKAPRDMDCFLELQSLSRRYGAGRMYKDFAQIYDMTEKEINRDVLDNICWLAGSYGKNSLRVDTVFSILYMAMVAEERKAGTRLGKRIKRLGVHQLLMEHKSPYDSANFTRGMDWKEIAGLCEEHSF